MLMINNSSCRRRAIRPALLLLAAAGLATAAVSGGSAEAKTASSTTTINFQLDWVRNSEYSGFYEAVAKGYYAADHLKVNILSGGNVSSTASVIAGGGAQLGIVSNMSRLYDADKVGTKLIALGAVFQTSPAAIMTLPKRKITSAKQLEGLRIGTDAAGKADINTLFAVNGLKPNWTFVPVGYTAAPLFKGQVDAYYVYANDQPIPYDLKGQHSNVITFGDLGFKSYASLIVTTKSYFANHKRAVDEFMKATQKGWQDVVANPSGAVALTIKSFGKGLGLESKSELASLKVQIPLMESAYTKSHGLLTMDPTEIKGPMAKALKASGRTNTSLLSNSYFDTTLLSGTEKAG